MRLTKFEITNFKSFGENTQKIEFKPITLLYGPNSSGKSSIFHALHYFYEVLAYNNCDPGSTHLSEGINLGGMNNLIYKHSFDKSIILRLDFEVPKYEDGPNTMLSNIYMFGWADDIDRISGGILFETAGIELHMRWSNIRKQAYVSKYVVFLNDCEFATIQANSDFRSVDLSFNYSHAIFDKNSYVDDGYEYTEELISLEDLIKDYIGESEWFPVDQKTGALPKFGSLLQLVTEDLDRDEGDESGEFAGRVKEKERIITFLSNVIVGSGELLKDYLSKIIHIGPLREIPPRNYEPDKTSHRTKWWKGLSAWDLLYLKEHSLTKKVNFWLEKLNSGYKIKKLTYEDYNHAISITGFACLTPAEGLPDDAPVEIDEQQEEALELIESLFARQNLLFLTDVKKEVNLKPEDVGVGISQIIPIIVAATAHEGNVALIEQPEIHLHPALQAELGDLFIQSALSEQQNQFIIETHSEHLLLRIMRRIRETAEERIEEGIQAVKQEDIMVAYVEPTEDSSIIREMPLNELGELVKAWPGGFFEEGLKEVF
ncbi:AAA family ATPase [bacterium]|nr:AAA family ATPase [bacterium]